MAEKPDAPAARRNREAILAVLEREFANASTVLEIGSGTGQHAVFAGARLPHLVWQASDRAGTIAGIELWVSEAQMPNVLSPVVLDVLTDEPPETRYDAVFSANTAHIMGMPAVERMFGIAGEVLGDGGVFCLYGPFNLDGRFTSASNECFDRSLRDQKAEMGLRDLGALDRLASANGLEAARRYAMPANNMIAVWTR